MGFATKVIKKSEMQKRLTSQPAAKKTLFQSLKIFRMLFNPD